FYRSSIFVLRFSHCLLLSPPPTPTLFPYTTLFRSVVVRGDNFSSDDETFTATAVDRHPTSPTFFEAASRGGYGKVTKIENIRTLSSQRAAYAAARGTLARITGGASDVDLSRVPHPTMEELDEIELQTEHDTVTPILRHVLV